MPQNITLSPLTDENLDAVLSLSVLPGQEKFVPSAAGIIGRAYLHRNENSCLHVICADGIPAGLILTWDMEEEPACHFLMEMFVDGRFQKMGIGTRALDMLIKEISRAPRFPMIELSVDRENSPAISLYEKAGFTDSGYVDPDLPRYINMVYPLSAE